jgi:hypothetical protein
MGFTKQILRAGNGLKPSRGQNVTVHCTGYGKNRNLAEKFWSTKDPGQEPFTFAVGLGQGELAMRFGRPATRLAALNVRRIVHNSYQGLGRECY